MALIYTEADSLLRESASGFLKEKSPLSALRQLRDTRDDTGFSKSLWQEISDMGWAGIVIPEQYGGLEYGYKGLGVLFEEMGRTLTASPLLSTVAVAASTLLHGGTKTQKKELLPVIASGDVIVAFALEEQRHHAPEAMVLRADRTSGGYILNGKKRYVIDGHVADKLIVVARTLPVTTGGHPSTLEGISLFLLDKNSEGISVERTIMVDSRNAANLGFDNVVILESALIGKLHQGGDILEAVLNIAQVCLSAELLGICQRTFEMTLNYLKERQQFGQLIGSFQSLQHRAALMYCEIELCKSVVLKALLAIDDHKGNSHKKDNALSKLASLTKAKLCETTKLITNEAIQLHGGIGMTDEFDLGFYIKRARAVQQTFGGYEYHLDRYARLSGF